MEYVGMSDNILRDLGKSLTRQSTSAPWQLLLFWLQAARAACFSQEQVLRKALSLKEYRMQEYQEQPMEVRTLA